MFSPFHFVDLVADVSAVASHLEPFAAAVIAFAGRADAQVPLFVFLVGLFLHHNDVVVVEQLVWAVYQNLVASKLSAGDAVLSFSISVSMSCSLFSLCLLLLSVFSSILVVLFAMQAFSRALFRARSRFAFALLRFYPSDQKVPLVCFCVVVLFFLCLCVVISIVWFVQQLNSDAVNTVLSWCTEAFTFASTQVLLPFISFDCVLA